MFKEINLIDLKINVFDDFKKRWALLTSGTIDNHNSLTIGWGGFGVLWRMNIAIGFVRESRYTYQFLERNDYYTISFYDETYKDKLTIFGTKSGRDYNKDELTDFHIKAFDESVSYEEANIVIVCKIIYSDEFNPELFKSKKITEFYDMTKGKDDTYHHFYIGEIMSVYIKE